MSETETPGPTPEGPTESPAVVLAGEYGAEIEPDPPVPAHLGTNLDADLREKLHQLLLHGPGQLSAVYRAMVKLRAPDPRSCFR